ncbi:protealysin inhibitor emfourin [Microbacterium sp. B2969]|uniref:Protealysin inhibitor emfourin n=1 Tax=Microbacterium alkaliflavum TaxID=3248839 RepID=A0ABW7Q7J1_9MICO
MNQPRSPDDSPEPSPTLVVAVTRTGGFAGLTKRWRAEPRQEEASVWIALISRCPWDDPAQRDQRGADRFQWSIHARWGEDGDREADLADSAVTGPWRELVDAVRDWSDGTAER